MFRLVDHTADLAIAATAPTPEAALADAALGLTAVLTGRTDVHAFGPPDGEVHFVLEAPDDASLLVAVLSELLWLHESDETLWVGGGFTLSTTAAGLRRAEARGNGVHYDPDRHGRGVEVKAITYHGLRWERKGELWDLWVLLDL